MTRATALIILAHCACVGALSAQAVTVFRGVPEVRVFERALSREAQSLPRDQASNLVCVISEIDGRYYWASRENKQLVRVESGAYVTYVALDGSGYVRVVNPALRAVAAVVEPAAERFGYVEHLTIQLGSITYYGRGP